MSVACQVNWAFNFVVVIVWPHMYRTMGPYSFVAFGTMLLATFLFTLLYLPETVGRSVAEVQRAANEPRVTCFDSCDRYKSVANGHCMYDEDYNGDHHCGKILGIPSGYIMESHLLLPVGSCNP